MKQYYLGIDIGGMTVKGALIDEAGIIVKEGALPTGQEGGADKVASVIAELSKSLNPGDGEVKGIGMGCPGLIDSKNGVVVFAANLKFNNVPLASLVEKNTGLPVKIANDANVAALGEAKFGAGKEYSDSVLITLGTGVGGGIVIGGKLFEGNKSAGAEIGHMIIEKDGSPCTCGCRGCFEAYSSASALIKKTREEMAEHPESSMWKTYTLETVNGKTAFDYMDDDYTANKIIDWYTDYLAVGITNIANVFRPQIVLIGGGVSAQGERLISVLRRKCSKLIFGGNSYAPVEIEKASLGNRAGVFGAAALFMQ